MNPINNQQNLFRECLELGGSIGITIVAASLVSSPITALGAAIFGATSYVIRRPVGLITEKLFNMDNPLSKTIPKIVSVIAAFAATA